MKKPLRGLSLQNRLCTCQWFEDVLRIRFRILFLDAEAAIEAAPVVAEILRNELNQTKEWEEKRLSDFIEVAKAYLV